jgi:spore coat polysaccharide biosynthesis protein SpsF
MPDGRPRVIATIEARMGSSRLPGKVLKEAVGRPMLQLMIERARRARTLDGLVVATTVSEKDEPIVALCRKLGVDLFRGSEDHVLARVVEAGRAHAAEVSVLLTGDCPLIDPFVIDHHVSAYLAARPFVDYVSNCEVRSYPHGLDLQVLAWQTLADTVAAADRAPTSAFREHVGWLVRRHPERYRRMDIVAPPGLSNPFFRITLDTPDDLARISAIFEALYPANPHFTTADVLELAKKRGWIDWISA